MDFQPRDLGLLVSLDVLLAERSVTLAARRLGISQPAMSAQLSRLRQVFGDDLLVGNAHGMSLTLRAENMRQPLGEAIDKLRTLVSRESSFDPETDSRHFRISGTDLSLSVLLPRLMSELAARAPGVTIEAVPMALDLLAGRMERGELDFAVTSAENAPQHFPARLLAEEHFRVIWSADHPELRGPPDLEQFCRLQHVVALAPGGGIRDEVDDALFRIGKTREVGARVPSFLLVLPIIRATRMIAVVPGRLVESQPEGLNIAAPPLDLPNFQVFLSWHRRLHQDAACQWFRRLIAETVAGGPVED
ncbi:MULTISPECIES: LysR family transcriptional regulator [Paracoccus]|jgi:DNA-binding transcriptional LysR family regulator|nr:MULTISPECIES: LysR family transcriptional regulator [Paracoccus]MBD9527204.1 LysR family transcriptional regulator [Paracoccus sp. PAR01]